MNLKIKFLFNSVRSKFNSFKQFVFYGFSMSVTEVNLIIFFLLHIIHVMHGYRERERESETKKKRKHKWR